MVRYTKKNEDILTNDIAKYLPKNNDNNIKILNKLGMFEDIEDELKIDLPVIIKALQVGIYVKDSHCRTIYYDPTEVSLRYEYYAKKGRWYIYIDDFDAEEHIIDLDMYRWTWAIEEHEFREEK